MIFYIASIYAKSVHKDDARAAIKRIVEEWNFELEVVEDEKEDVELECDGDY